MYVLASHARLVEELSGDGAESTVLEVGTRGLDHPLRVALADRPRVGRRAPGAVPVEVTDFLAARNEIDDIEVARGAGRRVRAPAGVETQLLAGVDDRVLVRGHGELFVLVAYVHRADGQLDISRVQRDARRSPSACTLPQETFTF